MTKSPLNAVLQAFTAWRDEATGGPAVRAYFERKWSDCLVALTAHEAHGESACLYGLLRETACAAVQAGLLREVPARLQTPSIPPADPLAEACEWAARLTHGKVVTGGLLASGTGRCLDVLAAHAPLDPRFVAPSFASLVHQVDVRGRRALALAPRNLEDEPAATDADVPDPWGEKHAVSVALSRQARRTGDRRLLHTALTLNDWAVASHRRFVPPRRLAQFVRAIAEQEAAARHLAAFVPPASRPGAQKILATDAAARSISRVGRMPR